MNHKWIADWTWTHKYSWKNGVSCEGSLRELNGFGQEPRNHHFDWNFQVCQNPPKLRKPTCVMWKDVPVLFFPKSRKKRLDKPAWSSLSGPPHPHCSFPPEKCWIWIHEIWETPCFTAKNSDIKVQPQENKIKWNSAQNSWRYQGMLKSSCCITNKTKTKEGTQCSAPLSWESTVHKTTSVAAKSHWLVLQVTFSPLVTDRAVQGVVHQQELHHTLPVDDTDPQLVQVYTGLSKYKHPSLAFGQPALQFHLPVTILN